MPFCFFRIKKNIKHNYKYKYGFINLAKNRTCIPPTKTLYISIKRVYYERLYKKSLLVIYFLLLLQSVFAQDFTHVISNSENWKDVYSAIHYANLKGAGSDFLVSTVHGNLILNNLNKQNKIRVITSKKTPYVFNYPDMIKAKGFADADEITVDEANLELISELEDINNFIVVGDSYGYNVVAVAPYAVLTKSWVFLANRLNIYDIDAILSKKHWKIIIYGYVDRKLEIF